jgi:hypothetical protein
MKEINFPDWPGGWPRRHAALDLRFQIGNCRLRRGKGNVPSARDFIDGEQRTKQPESWKLENWIEAIRWFFREARARSDGARSLDA